jgi:hypothetical protein
MLVPFMIKCSFRRTRSQVTLAVPVFLAIFVLNLARFSAAQQTGGSEIARRVFPSVVLLICEDSHGQPKALGSGFVVGNEVIATNLHVVAGTSGGYAQIGWCERQIQNRRSCRERRFPRSCSALRPRHTCAVSPVRHSQQVSVGDEIYAIGNPIGLEGTISQGIVSGIRGAASDRLLQITAPISPGSSGGPVVNLRGEVIGLAVATLKLGQNLNFAVPSAYLASLLSRKTEPRPFPTRKRTEGKTGEGEHLGTPAVSGVTASGFLWKDDVGSQNDCEIEGQCHFSFTLRNNMRSLISNTRYVAVFYDGAGAPVDAQERMEYGDIRPGLALRVADGGTVDGSVRKLTRRVEIRILDFTVEKQ